MTLLRRSSLYRALAERVRIDSGRFRADASRDRGDRRPLCRDYSCDRTDLWHRDGNIPEWNSLSTRRGDLSREYGSAISIPERLNAAANTSDDDR